jgi:hypothetical protein
MIIGAMSNHHGPFFLNFRAQDLSIIVKNKIGWYPNPDKAGDHLSDKKKHHQF